MLMLVPDRRDMVMRVPVVMTALVSMIAMTTIASVMTATVAVRRRLLRGHPLPTPVVKMAPRLAVGPGIASPVLGAGLTGRVWAALSRW
jgi:hypothetical protein